MRALTQRLRRRLRAITRAGSPQHCRLEALESRTLLSVSWAVDSNRTLQITSDDSVNSLRLGTHDGTNLELYYYDDAGIPYLDAHHDLVDMSTFDRINVQMGAGQYNYVTVVEGYSDWLPVSQPANIDVGGGGRPDNIMFFYTPVAKLSGDGVTGGLFSTGDPQVGTVSFKNTPSTHVIGGNVDTPAYFDCSAFTGQGLALFGTYGNDTLIGGTGSTSYFGGDGNDTIKVTGGHNPAYGGPGNDTYIGGPGDGGFQGEEGDDTFIHGTGRDGFDGGPGNNTAYATAPSGASTILLGTWVAGGASPGNTYVFFGDSFSNSFSLLNTQSLNVDAGAGVQDGIIPATPGMPYPDLGIAGIDPNLNLQITHLEPTVDAGPDASLTSGGAFAASGSFRDIGDPGNAWTATVDYGDGTGPQPLAITPGVIPTASGPAHAFDLTHDYQAAGTYTVTVTVTDSEGDQGTDTGTVNIASVNHAPVLSGANDFPSITEDNINLGYVSLPEYELTRGHVTDADQSGNLSAIAIVGQDPGNGTWQYLNGAAVWIDIGSVSDSSALLIGGGTPIRFRPDGKNGTLASLTFRAWDMSNGSDLRYTLADTTINGGSTPYSAATATTHITVADVNDSPVVNGGNNFPAITEDDVNNSGQTVAALLSGQVSDVDNNALPTGIAVTGFYEAAGIWQYSLDGGLSWLSFGPVSVSSATVLGSDARVRLEPNGQYGTSSTAVGVPDSITFSAWDQSDGLASGTTAVNCVVPADPITEARISPYGGTATVSLAVQDLNDAPVLTGVDDFPTLRADDLDNAGTHTFGFSELGHESDVDLNAPYTGNANNTRAVAIVGQDPGNGTWQYFGGGVLTWKSIGAVSNTSALLITDQAVRFVPNGHDGTTASLTLRAWDGFHTLDLTGTYADVSINGGTTPYSTQTAVTHIIVTPTIKTSTLSLANSTAIYGGITTLTATLQSNGSPIANALVSFTRSDNSLVGTAFTDANGVAVLNNVSIAGQDVGTYSNAFTASFAGDSGDTASHASASLTVIDENIEGMVWVDFNNDGNVDFGEQGMGGVSITLSNSSGQTVAQTATDANGLYVFDHVAPGTYTITEGAAPAGFVEGKDSLGTITDLAGNVVGTGLGNASVQNVFSAIPIGVNQNAINYNFGERPAPGSAVGSGQAATMGFWQNKNGQALILKFSSIGNWLADTMPQTFGGLVNASPQQVATLYQQQFVLKDKLDAQVMATALSAYATDASLGGAQAAAYGFTVGAYGLGDSTWNIGANGAAFGVANNTTLTIMQILQDWDQDTLSLKSSKTIRQMAIDVFGGINAKGGI